MYWKSGLLLLYNWEGKTVTLQKFKVSTSYCKHPTFTRDLPISGCKSSATDDLQLSAALEGLGQCEKDVTFVSLVPPHVVSATTQLTNQALLNKHRFLSLP